MHSASKSPARPLTPAAGAVCGLLAAFGYALANAALRQATATDASLVSAVKPMPTIIACAPLLIWMWMRGEQVATSWRAAPLLIAGSLAGQLIGNLLFQVSLGIVGLALAVPLCLSSMIIGGALLGRWLLGDPVSQRTVAAIGLLIIATCVLSFGTSASGGSGIVFDQGWRVGMGVASAFVSGLAFAFFSVTMRNALRGGMAVPMTMITSGLVGTIFLWPIAIGKLGVSQIAAIEPGQWTAMITAGCCNTLAFFLLSFALRTISVISVNLLNATQAALAAIFGVFWFSEPLTSPLLIGSGLTILGLVVLGTGKRGRGAVENRTKPMEDAVASGCQFGKSMNCGSTNEPDEPKSDRWQEKQAVGASSCDPSKELAQCEPSRVALRR